MDLPELRKEIDTLDAELAGLFARRMGFARLVAEAKRGGVPVLDSERERQVKERFASLLPPQLAQYGDAFMETVLALSRSYQRSLLLSDTPRGATVACQGTDGAFSHAACLAVFNEPNILFFRSFAGVFSAVEQGLCQYGIVPVENSTAGSVAEVRELLGQYRFRVVRAIRLKVGHCLLAKPGAAIEGIRTVVSHPQALGQCGGFLSKLNGAELKECANTAVAAREVAQGDSLECAAIASPECAELYGLQILARDIQDSEENTTRFLCVERGEDGFAIPQLFEEMEL
ncbi:MAG: chorismate mutase [Clostridium sp.]|jgi:chorismate mutase/prephenate dehydratase|nr:chorismate mutase [Clostridium sp.]